MSDTQRSDLNGSLVRHEAIKFYLSNHPELLGIDPECVLGVQAEVPIRRNKRVIAQPDLLFEYAEAGCRKHLFVEIKSGSGINVLRNLQRQLRRLRRHVRQENIVGEVIGVYVLDGELELLAS